MREITLKGMETTGETVKFKNLKALVTADKIGMTLSVTNDDIMFSIPLEPILKAITQEMNNL